MTQKVATVQDIRRFQESLTTRQMSSDALGDCPAVAYEFMDALLSVRIARTLAMKAADPLSITDTLKTMFVPYHLTMGRKIVEIQKCALAATNILVDITERTITDIPSPCGELDREAYTYYVKSIGRDATSLTFSSVTILLGASQEKDRDSQCEGIIDAANHLRTAQHRLTTILRILCGELLSTMERELP